MKPSWEEVAAAVIVIVVVARYIWAREFIAAENAVLESLGLGRGWKYAITVPMAGFVWLRLYQREVLKAAQVGTSVVSKPVIAFALLAGAAVLVLLVAAVGNA